MRQELVKSPSSRPAKRGTIIAIGLMLCCVGLAYGSVNCACYTTPRPDGSRTDSDKAGGGQQSGCPNNGASCVVVTAPSGYAFNCEGVENPQAKCCCATGMQYCCFEFGTCSQGECIASGQFIWNWVSSIFCYTPEPSNCP